MISIILVKICRKWEKRKRERDRWWNSKEKEFDRNNETPAYVILLAIFGISVPLLVLVGKQQTLQLKDAQTHQGPRPFL